MKTGKIKKIYMLLYVTLFLCSCSEEYRETGIVNGNAMLSLTVYPDALTLKSSSKNSFEADDKIGIFLSMEDAGNIPYNIDYENTPFQLTAANWKADRFVKLTPDKAVLNAYYPYNEEATRDGSDFTVPVDCRTGHDYMWGIMSTVPGYVDDKNTHAGILMHHALAKVQFRFRKKNYDGEGIVSSLIIRDFSAWDLLYIKGEMSVLTGKITVTEHITHREVLGSPHIIPDSYTSEDDYPSILTIPVTETGVDCDISLLFTIDGVVKRIDTIRFYWQAGYKSTYDIVLHGNRVYIEDVSIVPWEDAPDSSVIIRH